MNDTNSGKALGLGLIGCGAFGEFCMETFIQLDGVRAAAAADVIPEAAERFGKHFDIPTCTDPMELIAREDVDLVHIATPPSSHRELAVAAAKAGKHILCEKPLATSVIDGQAILVAAAEAGTIAPVNFVLRYNAVTDAVKAVIDSGVLGQVLSARLTNCAADSRLPADHWFWHREVSGGIFIEHGVHFFDLYSHWLGDGQVIDAHTESRAETDQEDRVMCTIRHDSGAIVSYYHAFDQHFTMDRTDHRLVCELGDIRVDGWIPLTMTVDAVVDDAGEAKLAELLPGAKIETVETFTGEVLPSRGQPRDLTKRIHLFCEPNPAKQTVYANSVRDLMVDQLAFIDNPNHARRVAEANGLAALALACRSVELASK
ncbi:MAG: Gfo/Idh/MocA family protein [Planctomycetota bacterium]